MADRLVQVNRPINGLQGPVLMNQRTDTSAGRAALRFGETLRASEGQAFRRGLSYCRSQSMPSRLQIMKPPILLQKGAQIDSKPIR